MSKTPWMDSFVVMQERLASADWRRVVEIRRDGDTFKVWDAIRLEYMAEFDTHAEALAFADAHIRDERS